MSQIQPVGVLSIGSTPASPAAVRGGRAGFAETLAAAEASAALGGGVGGADGVGDGALLAGDGLVGDEALVEAGYLDGDDLDGDELDLDELDLDELDLDELDLDEWDDLEGDDIDDADFEHWQEEAAAVAGGVVAPSVTGAGSAAGRLGSAATAEIGGARAQLAGGQPAATQARDAAPQVEILRAGRAAASAAAHGEAGLREGGESPVAPRASAGTLDQTPWLGVVKAPDADARGLALAQSGAPQQAPSEGTIVLKAPEVVRERVAARADAMAASAGRRASADAVLRAVPESRAAATEPVLDAAGPQPTGAETDGEAEEPKAADPAAARAAGARASQAERSDPSSRTSGAAAIDDGVEDGLEVAGPRTLVDRVVEAARTIARQSAHTALQNGRPTNAQLGQVPVADLDHLELRVDDGEQSFRLSVAREADGLNVEVKAPREVVADLRALEPEIEAALAEEGFELAHFDAQTESGSDGRADADAEDPSPGGRRPSQPASVAHRTAEAPPPSGQGRILNRRA